MSRRMVFRALLIYAIFMIVMYTIIGVTLFNAGLDVVSR